MKGDFRSKGFKITHTKTEYVNCNFIVEDHRDATTPMRIEDQQIPQIDSF